MGSLCLFGIFVTLASVNQALGTLVQLTESASLRGTVEFAGGVDTPRPIYTFRGIPYAAPPVRFQRPVEGTLWNGTRDATEFGAICPQYLETLAGVMDMFELPTNMSEDCLFLNVWTPTLKPEAKKPVMVWIHGGGFALGLSNVYQGTMLCTLHDVVFVSINYRLGVLGFLSTGDEVAPGNYGLLDQTMALRWVNKHISRFGGDPDSVTIFGESAGAMSTSFHIVSPLSRGLFHRVISQSGVSTYRGNSDTWQDARRQTLKYAKDKGCTSEVSSEIVSCLNKLSHKEIVDVLDVFVPVVDHHFLDDLPYNVYIQKRFAHVDYIAGFNSDDGYKMTLVSLYMYGIVDMEHLKLSDARLILEHFSLKEYNVNSTEIVDLLLQEYLDGVVDTSDLVHRLSNMVRDFMFASAQIATSNRHSQVVPNTYLYLYDHVTGGDDPSRPTWVRADHADEEFFGLGLPFIMRDNYTDSDRRVSATMMTYWTNFAKTGDPNQAGMLEWPSYHCGHRWFLNLLDPPEVRPKLDHFRVKLWTEVIPSLDKQRKYQDTQFLCSENKANSGSTRSLIFLAIMASVNVLFYI